MTWSQNLEHADQNPPTSPRFVEASELGNTLQEAEKAGLMPILVPPPGPGQRGRLALVIEGAVEEVLSRRGGSPPGVGASSDLDTSLSDQVYRARLVGFSGLALGFPSLEGIANLAGSLDAEDSAVLRWWIAATQERPIRLYLAKRDRFLGVYGPPVSLVSVASVGTQEAVSAVAHEAPATVPEVAASVAAMELSSSPPEVTSADLEGEGDRAESDGAATSADATDETAGETPSRGPERTGGQEGYLTDPGANDSSPESVGETTTSPTASAMTALFSGENGPDPTDPIAAPAPQEPDACTAPLPKQESASSGSAQLSFEQVLDELLPDVAPPPRHREAPDASERTSETSAGEASANEISVETPSSDETSVETPSSDETSLKTPSSDETSVETPSSDETSLKTSSTGETSVETPSTDDETSVGSNEPFPEPAESSSAAVDLKSAGDSNDTSTDPDVEPTSEASVPPLDPDAETQWRTWVNELDAARGPKPLGIVERMFVSAYAPLQDALALGIANGTAAQSLETWGASFEKSYTDAFDALRLRGKRPTMVLDVPDIAHRLARLHGARAVQLMLVDGMRYDVGQRMHEHLRPRLEQRAALTERLLLWSALPTTTTTQLDLIGRGSEGLREQKPSADAHQPVARGRSAALPRRIKAGHREVFKLDLVEARISEHDELTPAILDAVAEQAAESVAAHFGRLRERTLAVVFGDHGFRVHDGDGIARQGGARPEEVLVPAYAWLVGRVH